VLRLDLKLRVCIGSSSGITGIRLTLSMGEASLLANNAVKNVIKYSDFGMYIFSFTIIKVAEIHVDSLSKFNHIY
jgi:hypothetical protein